MLDSILDLVKGEVGDALASKVGLNTEQVEKTWSITGETITDTISKETASNGLGGILNLFSKNDNDSAGNGMMENLGASLVSNLMEKAGFDGAMANTIKSMIVPIIISKFTDKVGGDSNMLSSLLGGATSGGGMGDMLKNTVGGLFK